MVSFILATLVSTAPLREIRDGQHVVIDVNLTEIQKGFEELPKQYRRIGDDQAYAIKSVGEFVSWSCPSRPELAQAMQGRQPEYYNYGDGMGEYYINLEVNGRYWYGWAYADLNADTVVFSVYCDYWDEETGDYYYDWAELTGKRGVAEYDLENPIDRFATKGEVSESVGSIRDGVNHLTGLLTSETKLWRTGKPNECGHGWGYMQHNLTNDLRLVFDACLVRGLPRAFVATMVNLTRERIRQLVDQVVIELREDARRCPGPWSEWVGVTDASLVVVPGLESPVDVEIACTSKHSPLHHSRETLNKEKDRVNNLVRYTGSSVGRRLVRNYEHMKTVAYQKKPKDLVRHYRPFYGGFYSEWNRYHKEQIIPEMDQRSYDINLACGNITKRDKVCIIDPKP